MISTHAPAKGATKKYRKDEFGTDISTHAPAKGATPPFYFLIYIITPFQPTLPRRERLNHVSSDSLSNLISTHAPAKGATILDMTPGAILDFISTHAPAKGATTGLDDMTDKPFISTHAPAKGATTF